MGLKGQLDQLLLEQFRELYYQYCAAELQLRWRDVAVPLNPNTGGDNPVLRWVRPRTNRDSLPLVHKGWMALVPDRVRYPQSDRL